MTSSTYNEPTHDEIRALLPWFVNGTLDSTEQDRTRQHLDLCPDCRRDLSELLALRESILSPAVSVLPPKPNAQDFLNRLDQPLSADGRLARSRHQLLVAASIGLVAIGAGLYLFATRSPPAGNTYLTAAGAQATREFEYVLELRLAAGTGTAERADLKHSLDALALNGPDERGRYQLQVRLPAYSLAELDAYCRELETHAAIVSAEAVALQLPVQGNRQ